MMQKKVEKRRQSNRNRPKKINDPWIFLLEKKNPSKKEKKKTKKSVKKKVAKSHRTFLTNK